MSFFYTDLYLIYDLELASELGEEKSERMSSELLTPSKWKRSLLLLLGMVCLRQDIDRQGGFIAEKNGRQKWWYGT